MWSTIESFVIGATICVVTAVVATQARACNDAVKREEIEAHKASAHAVSNCALTSRSIVECERLWR